MYNYTVIIHCNFILVVLVLQLQLIFSQVTFIYIVVYTVKIVPKQLHSNKQERNSINVLLTLVLKVIQLWNKYNLSFKQI